MLEFYRENQKIIHKLIINQIAIAALGLMVGFPANALAYNLSLGSAPNLIAGIFTAAMYFFVIYDVCWEWGSKYVSKKGDNLPTWKTAAKSSAFAYIPTFLITLAYAVFFAFGSNVMNVFKWILLLICNGMHFGTLNFILEYVPKNTVDWIQLVFYVVAPFLAIGICALGFHVGSGGKTMFAGYFHKKPDREQ